MCTETPPEKATIFPKDSILQCGRVGNFFWYNNEASTPSAVPLRYEHTCGVAPLLLLLLYNYSTTAALLCCSIALHYSSIAVIQH